MGEAAEAAVIDSPKLALADNAIGTVTIDIGVSQLHSDGIDTTLITSDGKYLVLHSDGENSMLMTSDGEVIATGTEANFDRFYELAVDRVKNDGENIDNPEIQALTAEKMAETVKEAIIKQKMAEAVAMVCVYTNGGNLKSMEFNLPAMYQAAENVMQAAKGKDHPAELLSINPLDHATEAVVQHVPKTDIETVRDFIDEHTPLNEDMSVDLKQFKGADVFRGIANEVYNRHNTQPSSRSVVHESTRASSLDMLDIHGANYGYLVPNAINVKGPAVAQTLTV